MSDLKTARIDEELTGFGCLMELGSYAVGEKKSASVTELVSREIVVAGCSASSCTLLWHIIRFYCRVRLEKSPFL